MREIYTWCMRQVQRNSNSEHCAWWCRDCQATGSVASAIAVVARQCACYAGEQAGGCLCPNKTSKTPLWSGMTLSDAPLGLLTAERVCKDKTRNCVQVGRFGMRLLTANQRRDNLKFLAIQSETISGVVVVNRQSTGHGVNQCFRLKGIPLVWNSRRCFSLSPFLFIRGTLRWFLEDEMERHGERRERVNRTPSQSGA